MLIFKYLVDEMQTSTDTRHWDAAGSCIEPSHQYTKIAEKFTVQAAAYAAAIRRPILLPLHRSLQARLVLIFKEVVTPSCET